MLRTVGFLEYTGFIYSNSLTTDLRKKRLKELRRLSQ
jgi:hypothetical protein